MGNKPASSDKLLDSNAVNFLESPAFRKSILLPFSGLNMQNKIAGEVAYGTMVLLNVAGSPTRRYNPENREHFNTKHTIKLQFIYKAVLFQDFLCLLDCLSDERC
jgi:hypothetical protein